MEWTLPGPSELSLDFSYPFLVTFVERPLLDFLAANEAGGGENAQVLACRGLAHAKFLRDIDAADAVLDEVTVDLWREMGLRIFQPVHDLKPTIVGERLDQASINHAINVPAGDVVCQRKGRPLDRIFRRVIETVRREP
jgi:hypothetical protein